LKKIDTYLICFLAAFFVTNAASAQQSYSHKEILDSFELIKKQGMVFLGYRNPPTEFEMRMTRIENMLRCLPCSELKKLMRHRDKICRTYGFMIATEVCFDSITAADKKIFDDTAKLLIHTREGPVLLKETLGQIAKSDYESAVEGKYYKSIRPQVENAIDTFISNNVFFPGSYVNKGFSLFTWEVNPRGLVLYQIRHSYTLKNRSGLVFTQTSRFVLSQDFRILTIDKELGDIIRVRVLKRDEWLHEFGK